MRWKNPLEGLEGRWNKLLALVVGAALVAAFLRSQKPHPRPVREAASAGEGVAEVETGIAERLEAPLAYRGIGTIRSRRQSELAARILAEVREVRVNAGDRVAEGEVLVKLDDAGLRSALEEAEATLRSRDQLRAEAQTELDRTRNLFAREASTKQELDLATFRVAEAVAQREAAAQSLEQARVSLGHAEVRAPFAGVVYRRAVDPGDLASPGRALLGLYDPQAMRLQAAVEEHALARLTVGTRVTVILDALEARLEGVVNEVVPEVDPATRTGTINVDLPSRPDFKPGMFGRVEVPAGGRRAIAVPREAAVRRGQMEMVFILEEGGAPREGTARARMRLVRFGRELGPQGRLVEVTGGIDAGTRVITRAAGDLRDGDPVRPVEAPPGGGAPHREEPR